MWKISSCEEGIRIPCAIDCGCWPPDATNSLRQTRSLPSYWSVILAPVNGQALREEFFAEEAIRQELLLQRKILPYGTLA